MEQNKISFSMDLKNEEKPTKLKDVINASQQARANADLVYDYDNDGKPYRVDGLPLTRKERRMFKQMEARRVKKLKNIRFQAKKEQEKIDRLTQTETETEGQVKGSN